MSVAESKTNALFDQGFAQTGVMLRKEDKACIVTDMGRVEWFQVNPWGGLQALIAAPAVPAGWKDVPVNPTPEIEQAYREGWAACRDAETIGEEAEDWAFGNSTANSRMIDAQQAAPQQEAQEPTEIPEEIERMAADRYKVVPSHESMFHRWAVVAGTGTQQLYLGREVECQNMARKFAGAFLDGAFVAMQRTAPKPAPAPLSESIDQLERELAIIGVVGAIDGHDVVRRESVLEIARRAALAAQGGKA